MYHCSLYQPPKDPDHLLSDGVTAPRVGLILVELVDTSEVLSMEDLRLRLALKRGACHGVSDKLGVYQPLVGHRPNELDLVLQFRGDLDIEVDVSDLRL